MKMKKRARSEEQKQNRRDSILTSAQQLFSEYGYQSTTIEMITKNCNLSPAAFYLYFDGKMDIYRTLNNIGIEVLQNILNESLAKSELSVWQKIEAVAESYYRFYMEHRELYEITAILHLGQKEFFKNSNMVPLLENKALETLHVIENILNEGVSSGLFRPMNTWETAIVMWGTIDGIIMLDEKKSTSFTNSSLKNLIRTILTILLDGLKAE